MLNLYLGAVSFITGIIVMVTTTKRIIKSKFKIKLLAFLQFMVSFLLSLLIWRFWIFDFDIMLGFISLPATIAEIITISIIYLIIKKRKNLE